MKLSLALISLLNTSLFLSACGGGSSDDNNSATSTSDTSTDKTSQVSTDSSGFRQLDSDLFASCKETPAGYSSNPERMQCLTGTYKGVNERDKACLVVINGTTRDIHYQDDQVNLHIFGSEFSTTTFAKINASASLLDIVNYAIYSKTVAKEEHSIYANVSYRKSNNQIQLKLTTGSYPEIPGFKNTCAISTYKPTV